jgi:hypothetical protein
MPAIQRQRSRGRRPEIGLPRTRLFTHRFVASCVGNLGSPVFGAGQVCIPLKDRVIAPSRRPDRSLVQSPLEQAYACKPECRSLTEAGLVLTKPSPERRRPKSQGSVAGDENGLVASATNMTSALKSLVPLLETSIGMPGPCPGMA